MRSDESHGVGNAREKTAAEGADGARGEWSHAARIKAANWAHFERVRTTVGEASRALGAPVAPLKGAWLVASGLRHAPDRPMRDADVLVSGMTLLEAARRLRGRGFELVDVPRAFGVLSFRRREPGAPWLDLHVRPLPPGVGRLTAAQVFEGARHDQVAFDAPVLLARPAIMAVQLVGNVLKDRLLHAHPEAPRDLEAVLRAEPGLPERVADAAVGASLREGAMLVVEWATSQHPSETLQALGEALVARGADRDLATSRLGALRALEARMPPASRLLARAVGDSTTDRALGIVAALAGNVVRPVRSRAYARLLGS